jgi:chromosome segregation ATPase
MEVDNERLLGKTNPSVTNTTQISALHARNHPPTSQQTILEAQQTIHTPPTSNSTKMNQSPSISELFRRENEALNEVKRALETATADLEKTEDQYDPAPREKIEQLMLEKAELEKKIQDLERSMSLHQFLAILKNALGIIQSLILLKHYVLISNI